MAFGFRVGVAAIEVNDPVADEPEGIEVVLTAAAVAQRQLEAETRRRELELAAERKRRLREIYEDRGDLQIRVED